MANLSAALGLALIMFIWVAFGVLLIFSVYFIACELRDFFQRL